MELTVKRSTEEILAALLAGQLDINDVHIAEVTTVEKFDCTGDAPKLFETVTVTKKDGQETERVVTKH